MTTRLLERLRTLLRSSPVWLDLRAIQREGWLTAFRRRRLWGRILTTPPVRTAVVGSPAPAEVHTLCYRRDYLAAVWALKSFYRESGVDWPLVIHMNGPAGSAIHRRLRDHFPDARVVTQTEANRDVENCLTHRGLPRLSAARGGSPFMLKLTDFILLSGARRIVVIDSDVLFFTRPTELLSECQCDADRFLFQKDPECTYNISGDAAANEWGINLPPRVNTGIMTFPREILDLGACERFLKHPGVATPNGYIEQTLYALCAGEQGSANYLPDSYLVDLRPGLPYHDLVARHYAGPSRPLLTSEGMPLLLARGFPDVAE